MSILELLSLALINSKAALTNNASHVEGTKKEGISTISNGFANNKYVGEAYDETKPMKYITYLHPNIFHGWAMCQPLPIGNLKWMQVWDLAEGLTVFDLVN